MKDTARPLDNWGDVLKRLVGVRLAAYDDVVRLGSHADDWTWKSTAHCSAVEWLIEHRLLERNQATGAWRAVPIEEARAKYESEGPQKNGETPEDRKTERQREGERETPARQEHQAQWFDLEGYREI
jgi:hypothetical protein